jgi:hypothetical protein
MDEIAIGVLAARQAAIDVEIDAPIDDMLALAIARAADIAR